MGKVVKRGRRRVICAARLKCPQVHADSNVVNYRDVSQVDGKLDNRDQRGSAVKRQVYRARRNW